MATKHYGKSLGVAQWDHDHDAESLQQLAFNNMLYHNRHCTEEYKRQHHNVVSRFVLRSLGTANYAQIHESIER